MRRPEPPCAPDCPRRSWVCHNREICLEWGKYEDAMEQYRTITAQNKKAEKDLKEYRIKSR